MELSTNVPTVLFISLVLLQSSTAQIGLNWNRLRGENTDGASNITGDGDIRDVLTGIWNQLQDIVPNLDRPDDQGDYDEANVTIPEFEGPFEGLQYVSPLCLNQTMTMISDFTAQKRYAKQMVYSSGSLPDGSVEFTGLTVDYGLFQQCRNVKAENDWAPFDAEYCIMSAFMPGLEYHTAVCVPASCDPVYDLSHMVNIFKDALSLPGYWVVSCEIPKPLNGADIFVIFLCVVLGMFMLMGTLYHLIKIHTKAKKDEQTKMYEDCPADDDHGNDKKDENLEELEPEDKEETPAPAEAEEEEAKPELENMNIQEADPKEKPQSSGKLDKVLMCFSVIHNFGKIFDVSKQKGVMGALNGLRVISMFWIILGHTWQFIGTYKADNPIYVYLVIMPKFWFHTVLYGVYAVDTFFLLSGLLLAYLTLKALKKGDGKIKWGLFIFHRFYRITPLYMLVLGVWATLPAHIVDGPSAQWFFGGARETCREKWWTNMAYINNLFPFPGDLGAQCMGWSWYLANDMQFFIISPLILILLYKKRNIGFAMIGVLFLISYCSTIGIAYHYGLTIGVNQVPFNNNTVDNPTADHLYGKPYHRIQPYLIGILLGYYLFKLEGKKFEIPRIAAAGLWLVAAATALALVYGLHNTTKGHIVPQGTTIFYYAVNATAWGLAVGWVAFACIKGYGGPVNTILSWPIWTPLARLTFAAYLVHPMVQFMYIFSLPTQIPPTPAVMTYHVVAFIFMSYATALVFSLAIEAPLMGLEKIWFKRH